MATLFLLSCKWKRPDRWSLLKEKENMFNRLNWSSAHWNLHSRKSPPLFWADHYHGFEWKGERGQLGCAVSNPSQDHSVPDTASFPCRKCIHSISESYHILPRFLKSQPSNSNKKSKVLHRLPPRKFTWKRNCWEINSASKENRVSQILLTDHRPCLWEERLHSNLDFESIRPEFSVRQDLLSLLLGILMILQDHCLKARGKIHSVVLKYWS